MRANDTNCSVHRWRLDTVFIGVSGVTVEMKETWTRNIRIFDSRLENLRVVGSSKSERLERPRSRPELRCACWNGEGLEESGERCYIR